jgi:hypothetical protein
MNTILVNCSKEKAEVSDENGRFLCRVANGIKIDVGDEISVEQIAVNSIGVGSNIIEIPSQQLNYNYSTNRFVLKTAFYIHHNYEFTCAMPLTITSGGGDMGNIQLGLNTAPFRQGYGYFNGTPTDVRFQVVCPRWEAPDIIAKQSGRRYYLLDYVEGSNIGGSKYPADSWWDFIESEVPIEVDIGYDNPGNLAGKITEDLKSTDLHSAVSLINTRANPPIPPPPMETENDSNSVDNVDNKNTQASISSPNGIIQTRPVNFTNGNFANPERLYCGIATQNPYLWKYGTRLINAAKPTILSPELGRKVIQPITNLAFQSQIPDQRQVYNLYDLETNAAGNQNVWENGYVIPLNLEWNAGNIEMLQKFIYSQSTYEAGGGFSNSNEYVKQTPGVQSKMRWSLRSGRTNDYLIPTAVANIQQGLWSPASWNAAAVPVPTLAAPLPAGATPPPNTNIESLNTYFQQDLWDKRYLGKSRLYGNYAPAISVNSDRPYKTSLGDADAPDIVVSGVGNLRPYEVAKFYNMNITAVKIGGKNADGTPGVADEYVIGLVMNSKTLPVPVAPNVPIRAGNYMLVDLGMTQMNNSCVQLLNPNTQVVVADLTAANPSVYDPSISVQPSDWIDDIQVGSPNALFLFEPGRGRFGFQDLHWKKYTGNGYLATSNNPNKQPNPSGSVAVNEYNRTINYFLNPKNQDKTDLPFYIPYFEFTGAVSGIGLQDVGLYPTSHNNILNAPPITYLKTLTKSQRDAAYKGSLLDRFGFEYNYLFNEFGFSECMFNSKYYSNGIPSAYPQFYPSPLTTNSLIDTAMALNFDYNADGNPNFSLNFLNGFPNRNSSSESAIIYATNLPQKLVFPFWLIHSDIIGGIEFHSENAGSTSNIVAICNRAYTSGDFAFSFATDYTFTATQEYVISGINTQILNPDLTPADVNDRTSIVYKIQKRIPMFEAPKVLPDKKKPADFTDKTKADRARNDALQMPSVFSLT